MLKFLKDNWEEWFIGFILGLGFFPVLGLGSIVLGVVTGILFRMGGAGIWKTKAWRRVGIPLLLVAIMPKSLLGSCGGGLASWGLLTLGYGTLTLNPDGSVQDPGSPLGNWWKDHLGERWGSVASRLTIIGAIWLVWGVAYGLSQGR